MIEILSIILQLFIFLIIFSYPINVFNYSRLNLKNEVNLYLVYSLNIIIHLNIYLFLSFISINIKHFYYLELILFLIFIFFYRTNYLNAFKEFTDTKFKYFLFFLLGNLIFFVTIANGAKLEWDGLAHWIYKARIFFDGGSYFDFKDNVPFPYYPQLGTFIWGYFWKNTFLNFEYFGRLIFPLIYLFSIFSVACTYKTNKNYLIKILLTIFLILLTLDFYLFGGYQEYLLFFLFTILGIITFEHLNYKNKIASSFFIILILNLIIWTKQEGFFYSIIFGLTLAIFSYNNIKFALFFLISTIILATIHIHLKSFVIDATMFNEKIFNEKIVNYLNVKILIKDLILIFKHIIIASIKYPVIIFVTFLLLVLAPSINTKRDYFFYCIFILNLFFIIAIYLQTNMNLEQVLPVTIDRVLFQSTGLYLVFIIYKLNKKFKL